MLRHADIWFAIDHLARAHGLSPSGLARAAGLDPTTFNRSKRITRDGKPRWPSTESIAKVLEATGARFDDFAAVAAAPGAGRGGAAAAGEQAPPVPASPLLPPFLPLLGLDQAAAAFDAAGRPHGPAWDRVEAPALPGLGGDPDAYVLEVAGPGLRPVYRDGDRLLVSPAAVLRRGDRVVVLVAGRGLLVGELGRESATRCDLLPIAGGGDAPPESLPRAAVAWMARILWASQ